MNKQVYIGFLTSIVILAIGILLWGTPTQSVRAETASLSTIRLPESKDFATVTFSDPWDLDQISDVSQYLNGFGRNPSMTNIQVQDGIFSATSTASTTDLDAFIFPLFPGLSGFMQIGEWGEQYPINPTQYQCFYIAMKVNSTASNDAYRLIWYTDKALTPPSMTSSTGSTYSLPLYPEWGANRYWKLFMVNLANPPIGTIGQGWTAYSPWQGLEVILTHADSISFAIDWIRLTPCHTEPQYRTTVTWSPSANVTSVWVRPQGTTRDVRVANGLNGLAGSYQLDTQGLAPGFYSVGLGDDTTCCSQWSADELEITAGTILDFDSPSPTSGDDFATTAGDAWDMNTASDMDRILCSTWQFSNSLLMLDTDYPAIIDDACLGPGVNEADSRTWPHMPSLLAAGRDYRYLSYRMYQNGVYPLPVDGMVIRWIWTTPSGCVRVSHTAALDVGWHEYNIDLYNSFNGTPEQYVNCPVDGYQPWSQVGDLRSVRFDPNENWTGNLVPAMIFHQQIDWIRLTKVDGVARGSIFPIYVTLNKDPGTVQYIDFYYTTNRSQPLQNYIGRITPGLAQTTGSETVTTPVIDSPQDNQILFLPFMMRNHSPFPPLETNQVRYLWDTSSIPVGEYYICGQAYDGLNLTTYCSQAPLQIRNP